MNIKCLSKKMYAKTSAAIVLGVLASSVAVPETVLAANPVVSHVYTADPAARVFNGRVYVVTTHDQDTQTDYSQLKDYYLFSSDDMVNWQDHGIIWNSKTNTNWANLAYAPDFIERNGKYYLYFPDGGGSIGVAVADKPEGPYVDPLGHPLVDGSTPNGSVQWIFDPGVFIDDDGQAYLYFGGGGEGNARVIKLNDDMISTSGSAISLNVPNFFEALYMHKHNGTYYLSYSSDTSSGMKINYMTSNNPTTGFTYRGTILPNPWENNFNNNHASIIDYKGKSYIFYHNRAVANARGASTFQRSINVDLLEYNADGTIKQVNAGRAGAPQLKTVNAFNINQAEMFDEENGIETENASDGTLNIMMGTGDWIKVSGVNFGNGAQELKLRAATESGSSLDVILDSLNNSPVATIDIDKTGGWQKWQTQSTALNTTIRGVHDVYLRANGWHNLNWYQFIGNGGNAGSSSLAVELESLSGQSSFSPLTVKSDSGASNGQYIEWPNNGSHQALSSPSNSASGQVAIKFNLSQTTNVGFEMLASLAAGYDDSFYYRLDSGSWITQNNTATNGWGKITLQTFNNVAAGDHTLRILRREDGAKLDKVTLNAANGNIRLVADDNSGNGGNDGGYQVPSDNFADNGGAEGSLMNWSKTAGSLSLSYTQSHSGSSSAFITGRSANWHGMTFNVGSLVNGNQYDVAVWVKLAAGSADTPIKLTAKRRDDGDNSTYNEYEQVATAVASANRWTLLQGFYTQSGTPFEHFIIESDNETVSFYADDFSIGGEAGSGNQTCDLKSRFSWTSTGPLISPQRRNWASIKDPTIVRYNNKYHVFATVFDTARNTWGGVYFNFSDWSQAGSANQVDMNTTRAGNTVAPQVFFFEPEKKWYMIYQWGAKYSTNTDISNPAGWTTPKPLLRNGLNNGIDYWVICDDNYCHLFFSGDDGKLYRSKVSIGNFPNFSGYEVVMQDSVARLFEASNVYKVEGTNKYLLLVEAYSPRYFRSWTSTSLDGPWTPLADTKSNPFAGEANVSFPGGKWTNDISHGEMIRSGYDQTLKISACNMQYLYQGQNPNSGVSDYNRLPYRLGLISAK
ncbi:non-reducing end alpha-L-arabinofuranosidase family hydrolase [Vibrio gazogenes]|uniref:non-reducing end alpha-L-arabinofuranosidase family hydrolase n=1 Tax=Vibrio gazogenes TaxID=687 RepID=UPI000B4945A1|nr:non-reducing end alpha-L-arabinofuranosidase family hydrolase [Vibrio gazogenes]